MDRGAIVGRKGKIGGFELLNPGTPLPARSRKLAKKTFTLNRNSGYLTGHQAAETGFLRKLTSTNHRGSATGKKESKRSKDGGSINKSCTGVAAEDNDDADKTHTSTTQGG